LRRATSDKLEELRSLVRKPEKETCDCDEHLLLNHESLEIESDIRSVKSKKHKDVKHTTNNKFCIRWKDEKKKWFKYQKLKKKKKTGKWKKKNVKKRKRQDIIILEFVIFFFFFFFYSEIQHKKVLFFSFFFSF
jgi:hypothetical protein